MLLNPAHSLFPDQQLDESSKTKLGRSLADELGVPWTDTSYSTGYSISLEGLNLILAGAERQARRAARRSPRCCKRQPMKEPHLLQRFWTD